MAVTEWLPTDKLEIETLAVPPLIAPLPRLVVPSKKVTVPETAEGATVAVNVTVWPLVEGLILTEILVEVLVFAG